MYKLNAKPILFILLVVFLQACATRDLTSTAVGEHNESDFLMAVINDTDITREFTAKASEQLKQGLATPANELKKQLFRKSCQPDLQDAGIKTQNTGDFYTNFGKGILIVGSLMDDEKYDGYHLSTATAFAITKDGVCVSNYHVFKSYDPSAPKDYEGAFVMDHQGNVYPIVEILAASKSDDLAIFRIACNKDLPFLELGQTKPPGTEIKLISHPKKRYYRYSSGEITRSYIKAGTNWHRQSISAEFAVGSSGGPIMDSKGKVVGIVAGTQNIFADPQNRAFQMTIKEIIPVDRLKALIDP